MSAVGFWVVGTPAPQGSKRHVGNGVMIESSNKVKPWRTDVALAAIPHRPETPLDGPLHAYMVFTLPRPKSAAKSRTAPDRYPDLSKLIRCTEDALTTAGIWADDARVVSIDAAKVWFGLGHSAAMPVTGAIVCVATDPVELDRCAVATIMASRRALRAAS